MSEARQMLAEMARGTQTAFDDSYTGQLLRKWAPLLEGIQHPYLRRTTAMLLENQASYLGGLTEDTLSNAVGPFTKYIFPLLRRVFPNLIANQIVSVQPMTAPVGGIFFYEYKYGDEKGNGTTGTLNKNLIQEFAKYYSSEFVDYHLMVASGDVDGIKTTWNGTTNSAERNPLTWLPVHPKDLGKQFVMTVTFTVGATELTLTDDGAGNLKDSGGVTRGTIAYETGQFTLTFAAPPDAATPIWASYYYDSEKVALTDNARIPSMNLDVSLQEIKAKSRKLKFRWSAESADDLRALHGKEAESELVAGAANEVSLELDREIVTDLLSGAAHQASWAYSPTFGGANVLTEIEAIRHLLTIIDSVGSAIHKYTQRAPGNFLVVPPSIGALLNQLTTHGDFVAGSPSVVTPQSYGVMTSHFGVTRLGTLLNKYTVFQDPYQGNEILVGLVGGSYLDAGYVYAPYVPLQVTNTFQDPDDFHYRKGMRTRYATRMLRPEFYGKIAVSGLPTVTTTL